jgi:nucleoside 2-deoxyribosyltransferase
MKKVYIAGPYSAPDIISGLENIRRGMRMAARLLQHGVSVFCPWVDHQLFLQLRGNERISLETIQAHSIAWLKVSDAVLALRGWEKSRGTLAEIQVANECKIPVFFNEMDLMTWVTYQDKNVSPCSGENCPRCFGRGTCGSPKAVDA